MHEYTGRESTNTDSTEEEKREATRMRKSEFQQPNHTQSNVGAVPRVESQRARKKKEEETETSEGKKKRGTEGKPSDANLGNEVQRVNPLTPTQETRYRGRTL